MFCFIWLGIFNSPPASAHGGTHETQESVCLLEIGDYHYRLSGFLPDSAKPKRRYCRMLPQTGRLTLVLEPLDRNGEHGGISLTLRGISSWNRLLRNPAGAFDRSLAEVALPEILDGNATLERELLQKGVYALDIDVKNGSGEGGRYRFYFLFGFPVVKTLVALSVLLFGLLCLIVIRKKIRERD
ncbi:MAG: hypothetical protein ACU833_05310 [Gammaproteobacteria bacterium]